MDETKDKATGHETASWLEGSSMPTIQVGEISLAGQTLGDRYLIKQELGRGGFGAVYLALDQKMVSRPVVVKVMLDPGFGDEWSGKKFQQEIEALARIDHPSIVGIFDAGETADGKPYLVMQYVDGVSMRSAIRPEGMDFVRAANIIRQIGKALSSAHSKGILHRDLKPENIMLRPMSDGDEQVKVIDFGVAQVRDSVVNLSTGRDRAVGTIAYMSPEQLSALPLSSASDVYSFAVMAYEMLTGRRPLNPESVYQLLAMQKSGVRVRPVDLRPNFPPAAEDVLLRALAFEPGDRYQKVREFGDQLAWALIENDGMSSPQAQILAQALEASMAGGSRGDSTAKWVGGSRNNSAIPTIGSAPAAGKKLTSETLVLETAHVLCLDIVSYSKLLIDEQPMRLYDLQEIIRETQEFARAQAANQLMRLPTGDGMALVFFGDPEAPVRCAMEICRALEAHKDIKLRMGIHSGMVYRMADINTNMNVSGGGINLAQRVMDCGDAGHILVSQRVAGDLEQLSRWSNSLHDLGEAEVKDGVRVHVYNLHSDGLGNPEVPSRLRRISPSFFAKHASVIRGAALVLALAIGLLLLALNYWPKSPEVANPSTNTAAAAAGKEQALAYWLTVQKTQNGKDVGSPIESTGSLLFENGWKFRLNLRSMQSGFFYLLNVGPGQDGREEYNVLYPTAENNNGDPFIAANQIRQTKWYFFVERPGVEKLWLIWSDQPLSELDSIFQQAVQSKKDPGEIRDPEQIERVKGYLTSHGTTPPEVVADESKNLTTVKGRGETLVSVVELYHKPQSLNSEKP